MTFEFIQIDCYLGFTSVFVSYSWNWAGAGVFGKGYCLLLVICCSVDDMTVRIIPLVWRWVLLTVTKSKPFASGWFGQLMICVWQLTIQRHFQCFLISWSSICWKFVCNFFCEDWRVSFRHQWIQQSDTLTSPDIDANEKWKI